MTLNLSQPPPPTGGLVGSWSFDEASGATVQDASGRGNPGTISGPARVAGRFGGGLSFDGVNDWVTVADSASLHLTTAMTIEAWVRPTALSTMWRTVAIKERLPGELAYALYANTDTTRPSGHVSTSQEYGLRGPAALHDRIVDAPGHHLGRHHAAPVRERDAGGECPRHGHGAELDQSPALRRQLDLVGVVRRR